MGSFLATGSVQRWRTRVWNGWVTVADPLRLTVRESAVFELQVAFTPLPDGNVHTFSPKAFNDAHRAVHIKTTVISLSSPVYVSIQGGVCKFVYL